MKNHLVWRYFPGVKKNQFHYCPEQKDTLFPDVSIDIGDEIIMQDDAENNVFGGIIFDADKKGSSKTVKLSGI